MRTRKSITAWVWSSIATLAPVQAALACAFHGYTPNPTAVDVLLGTEQIVIARPASSDPNRLAPVETLAGPPLSDIPVTVDTATQRRLAANADSTVLLARDGAYGPWLQIAVLDPRYRAVMDHVIARQSAWLNGNEAERLSFFAKLVNDPNPDVRRLALQELDRVSYSDLRDARVPMVRTLGQDIVKGDGDLKPIRILLAGLSGDATYSALLQSELAAAVPRDVPHLGAYATALVELDGQAGVAHILDNHLTDPTLLWGAREKLLQALAIQYRVAPGPTRRSIARGIAELSRSSPDMAEAAARQFGSTDRWRRNPAASQNKVDR